MERFLAQTPELADSDKRSFLYSDLSQLKLDNPEGYHEAVEFWTRFLLRLCQNGLGYSGDDRPHQSHISSSSSEQYQSDSDGGKEEEEEEDVLDRINSQKTGRSLRPVLCLSTRKLATRLSFHGDTPAGLDVVEEQMRRRGTMAPAVEYFSTRVRRWAGWAVGMVLPSLPGRFVASIVMGAQVPKGMDSQTLIASSLIGDAAQRILDLHYSDVACPQIDGLMSIREFRCKFVSVLIQRSAKRHRGLSSIAEMSAEDASILVKYMSDNRYIAVATVVDTAVGDSEGKESGAKSEKAAAGAAAFADGETTLIKFAPRRTERIAATPTASSSGPISEADRGVYQVKSTRLLISRQVDQLEARISALDQQIRNALQRKQKNLAMAKLRLKRHIEENVLAKRVLALENVEKILWQLEQSSSDLQMLQVFRAGTLALRGMNQKAADMDADKVFDDWAQEAARAGEVEEALQDGSDLVLDAMPDSVSGAAVDEQLEAELDAMIAATEPAAVDKSETSAEALVGALESISIAQPALLPETVPAEPQNDYDRKEESKVAMPAE
ncbi:hypothetical protein LPJ81_002683 [Coemansia sp. IMI 209127]|nr:hypothetical protein LPJ81_002683 [Coemansia sp. IMI 209127]